MWEKTGSGLPDRDSWSTSLKVLPVSKALEDLGLARIADLEVLKVSLKAYAESQEHCSKFSLWETPARTWNSTICPRKILTTSHLQDTL